MTIVRLIAGLGNPGAEHLLDRHNAGFWFADALVNAYGGAFRKARRYSGEAAEIDVHGHELIVFKPMAYMNRSGLPIKKLSAYRKIPSDGVLIAHDDLDLPPGTVRLKRGGGHGGHNGLRDAIAHLGADFLRLRFGVGHPGNRDEVVSYVLRRAPSDEEERIVAAVGAAVEALPILLAEGEDKAKNRLHSRASEA
ncbi:aminoacyl-tRNA hydrolase [soil metagenome]